MMHLKDLKHLSDKKKDIYDKDLVALVDNEVNLNDEIIKLINLDVNCGSTRYPKFQ